MPGSAVIATLIEVSQDISLFQAYFVYLENAMKKAPNTMRVISQVSVMCNDVFVAMPAVLTYACHYIVA